VVEGSSQAPCSGPVFGVSYTVQIAKYLGVEVAGVCSTTNPEMVRSLGADQVIDYTKENFVQSGETYDAIFDAVAKMEERGKESLKKAGISLDVTTGPYREEAKELVFLKELMEAGKIQSVMDRRYPLEQAAEAHRYVETGQKVGSVVLTIE
jgi:NADPH:quinone reductase-like Zn-dependent oxidoreductase